VAAGHAKHVEPVVERRSTRVAPRPAHGETGETGQSMGTAEETGEDTVGAFEAKTHLSRLLAEVQQGKRITITRRGVPVAVLAPPDAVRSARAGRPGADEEENDERAREAIAAWARYRDGQPALRATVAEILAWVKEGRR